MTVCPNQHRNQRSNTYCNYHARARDLGLKKDRLSTDLYADLREQTVVAHFGDLSEKFVAAADRYISCFLELTAVADLVNLLEGKPK